MRLTLASVSLAGARLALSSLVAAVLVAALGAGGAAAAIVPVITHTAPAVTATATPEDLKAALMAEAAAGKLTDPLIAHFKDYAAAAARRNSCPRRSPRSSGPGSPPTATSATRCSSTPTRDSIPAPTRRWRRCGPSSATRSRSTRSWPWRMSLVYGRAGTDSMREPAVGFTAKDRPPPSLEDSFGWYVKNERLMKMPLKTTPLPLAIYVADNDLPLDERDWALKKYAALQPAGFAKIYYEVPYDDAKIDRPRPAGR